MGFLKIMLVKEMETGNDDENDGEVSDYHDDDPDWSCHYNNVSALQIHLPFLGHGDLHNSTLNLSF
jgi:hypothetical protein